MENKKQKVGIVTLPGNFNYGNRLQNYAVTQAYESRGFKAESGANALVLKPIEEENTTWAGVPARKINDRGTIETPVMRELSGKN